MESKSKEMYMIVPSESDIPGGITPSLKLKTCELK